MKRLGVFIILLSLALIPCVFANPDSTIDSEMQELTHYAQEYEVGNINYVQLMIYVSAARESMNEILGVTSREFGGIVNQGELEKTLGEPNEETRWVWAEGANHDVRLDDEVPVWRRIVFDGKKLRIKMEVHPFIFKKKTFEDEEERKFSDIEDGALVYNLNFNTEFKRPDKQLDIEGKISEIQSLAEKFNDEPSNSNARNLAKQSVNAERIFQNYFMQSQGNCEDLMKSIFGSENQRESQKILLSEISVFEGDDFDAVMRLEMCDECEQNWINLDMRFEGKMNFDGGRNGPANNEHLKMKYRHMSTDQLKSEARRLLNEIKSNLEFDDFNGADEASWELNILNNAWNEKSNDVWDEVRLQFEKEMKSMSDKDRYEFDQNYGWIKQDQKQRKAVKELQEKNYQERKDFYSDLFSGYHKKEFYFTQTGFEKRLVEEFKEKGEEICNNNVDDNDNEQIDCADSQCGGKICGEGVQTITDGNETKDVNVDFYCIQQTCQAKEDIEESTEPVCGNHICEDGEKDTEMENGTCQSDCTFEQCPVYDAIECSGKVIFEGEDENGCSLPPICIEEEKECATTEDCAQPSCGVAECVKEGFGADTGICKITELMGCESECEGWEQDVSVCSDGKKVVTRTCDDGQWRETGAECESGSSECVKCGNNCITKDESTAAMCEEPTENFYCGEENGMCKVVNFEAPTIAGNECITISDCGGEDDVCSNGKCVSIPKVVREEVKTDRDIEGNGDMEKEVEVETNNEGQGDTDAEIEVKTEVEGDKGDKIEVKTEVEEENNAPAEDESQESPIEEMVVGVSSVLMKSLNMITGHVVEGEEVIITDDTEDDSIMDEPEDAITDDTEDDSIMDEPEDDVTEDIKEDHEVFDDSHEEEDRQRQEDEEQDRRDEEQDRRDNEERKEREQREKEDKERCANDCERPCVQSCIRDTCGEDMDCDIDTESVVCEKSCVASDDCIDKCMSGEPDWWKEFEEEDKHKEEKGVFQVGGGCQTEKGENNGYIWFGGWGEPFERIEGLKNEFYTGGDADWCKQDLDNLVKQRKEFEKGFNLGFAQWFFEKYLPNSANEWEQAQGGIYEVYWNNVDIQRQLAERMHCLGKNDVRDVMNITPISFEYETEFGRLEYWEEIKTVDMDWTDEKVTVVSPYMRVWVFPSEEFFKYEMKKSMEDGEFPGPPEENAERSNEEGLTEEEKVEIRENEDLMNLINEIIDKYNGNADVVFQIVDTRSEEKEIVFNLYVQINEEDVIKVKPMLPEEVPAEDVKIEVEVEDIYDLIRFEEENMAGGELESPPWDQRQRQGAVKGFTDGIRMYLKVRSLINSAIVTPASAEGDAKDLIMELISLKGGKDDKDMKNGEKQGDDMKDEDDMSEKLTMMTGEVTKPVFGFSE
ncbi:MAG: hypothetical protein OEL87_00575 [Nanoarchaeota archaeon]|nr:hypothetical protein [Nanoarchaeota archaeon]